MSGLGDLHRELCASGIRNLPTLVELQAKRRAMPKGATPSRLDERTADKLSAAKQEAAFKAAVCKRDHNACRCCGRQTIVTIELDPKRREVHHIHGRGKGLRYEVRAALVLCLEHHDRVTGTVGKARLFIVATKTFLLNGKRFTDANYPVTFKESA